MPKATSELQGLIDEAQAEVDRTSKYMKDSLSALEKDQSQYNELLQQYKIKEEEGEQALANELRDKAKSLMPIIQTIKAQYSTAEGKLIKDKARLRKLQDIAKKPVGTPLPDDEFKRIAMKAAEREARGLLKARGLPTTGVTFQKLVKKIYPNQYAVLKAGNKAGYYTTE